MDLQFHLSCGQYVALVCGSVDMNVAVNCFPDRRNNAAIYATRADYTRISQHFRKQHSKSRHARCVHYSANWGYQ